MAQDHDEHSDTKQLPPEGQRFGNLIAVSLGMRELFAAMQLVAPSELSVLVQGETGTGKEELARAIHQHSSQKGGPFVVFDAAAVPSMLGDAALFGKALGQDTGSAGGFVGVLERAHGGTLFIDKVGELPLELQAKLYRALESASFTRVGSSESAPLDIRLISATNRDLRELVDASRFREDLYIKLAEARAFIPPLRRRAPDVTLLVMHFLGELASPERPLKIEHEAIASLSKRSWPGNVRELRNAIARAAALSTDGSITSKELAGDGFGYRESVAEREAIDLTGTFEEARTRAMARFEGAYLAALLQRCEGDLSRASRESGIRRHHLLGMLGRRGLY
jgi:DNA-binding NtrC family response regulator